MGGALSRNAAQSAEIKKQFLLDYRDSGIKYASEASLEAFQVDDIKYLALAYQASDKSYEGSATQHIRFQLSKDGAFTLSIPQTPHKPLSKLYIHNILPLL